MGCRATPRGRCRAAERAWRGRCGAGARRGLGLFRGRGRLPGMGWRGRPGPQRRSTNRRRTHSRQEAREGGADPVGGARLVTPPCPGLAAQGGGGASQLTPSPLPASASSARPLSGLPGDLGASAGTEVSAPQPLAPLR
jgi:hypothetical protein